MKKLAIFDFDKTLYKKDSLLEFTKFCKGKKSFYLGIATLAINLFLMKIGFIKNEKMKKKFILHFFQKDSVKDFIENGKKFSLNEIDKNLNTTIFKKFKQHISENDTVYIVTASCPEWIKPWADVHNVKTIGTELKIINDKIAGFKTPNCYGKEKVNRINTMLNLDDFSCIKVYGKGKGDREMLQLKK